MSRYEKGRRLEYKVRDLFRSKGYVVIRIAQSKPVDLVCLKNGQALLVKCKTQKSLLTTTRKSELESGTCSRCTLLPAKRKGQKIEIINLCIGQPFNV